MNHLENTSKYTLFEMATYYSNSSSPTISQEKFSGLTHKGREFLSFGTSAKCVAKYTPAHLFVNSKNATRLATHSNPRASRKALTSDLQQKLEPVYGYSNDFHFIKAQLNIAHGYLETSKDDSETQLNNVEACIKTCLLLINQQEVYNQACEHLQKTGS